MSGEAHEEPLAIDAEPHDPLAEACELVGRFMYHFGQIEDALDEGIRKLFGLQADPAKVITASMDFSRKMGIVQSALLMQAVDDDDKIIAKIRAPFKAAFQVNMDRQIVAHSPFSPFSDGVSFDRSIAREGLNRQDPKWTRAMFEQKFKTMQNVRIKLRDVIREITPYIPSMDFSDPRNSALIAVI